MTKSLRQRNYDALDQMADLIEPMGEILTDKEALMAWRDGDKFKSAALMMKNHKDAVIEVLAALEGVPPERYEVTPERVIVQLVNRLQTMVPLIKALFPTRAQSAVGASSGPVTENTGEEEN